jgi:hypothetical protein
MLLNPRRRWKVTDAVKKQALEITAGNLNDQDGRVQNGAVANLLRMEAQNQADQLAVLPHLHVHGHGTITEVVETIVDAIEHSNPSDSGSLSGE